MNRAVVIAALLAAGCVADRASNPTYGCTANADCEAGLTCDRGFCVSADGGPACDPASQCYEGAPGTQDVGVCRAGCLVEREGEQVCEGQIAPSNEQCNSADDDCDGNVDEDFALDSVEQCGACDAQCAMGATCCAGREGGHECANLASDPDHCGACGNPCPAGQACCGGGCIDISTDRDNCGACGNSCAPGLTCCDGACVNTSSSTQHCGGCGMGMCETGETCCPGSDGSGPSCRAPGECVQCDADCDEEGGDLCCAGECVTDSQTNEAHCGGCGIACAANERCCGGSCVPLDQACADCGDECAGSEMCCDGSCSPITSTSSCGGCGVTCTGGQTCCGEAGCVDTNVNNSHCGGCNQPCGDEVCSNGHCCPVGTTWCGTECVPLTTKEHCGSCNRSCSGLTPTCMVCLSGQYGCGLIGC